MRKTTYDWHAISQNPQFITLQQKKTAFLISLWGLGALPYLLLIIAAAYAPGILKTRVFGRMNIGYLFCMFQFFTMIVISIYYNYRTNRDFDPLTKALLEEIHQGEAQ